MMMNDDMDLHRVQGDFKVWNGQTVYIVQKYENVGNAHVCALLESAH